MKKPRWLLLGAGCAGAGSAYVNESDSHRTVSADLGIPFTVSLPDSMKEKALFPPDILELASDQVDETVHRRILEFTAQGIKEVAIRVGKHFTINVRVTSTSD